MKAAARHLEWRCAEPTLPFCRRPTEPSARKPKDKKKAGLASPSRSSGAPNSGQAKGNTQGRKQWQHRGDSRKAASPFLLSAVISRKTTCPCEQVTRKCGSMYVFLRAPCVCVRKLTLEGFRLQGDRLLVGRIILVSGESSFIFMILNKKKTANIAQISRKSEICAYLLSSDQSETFY